MSRFSYKSLILILLFLLIPIVLFLRISQRTSPATAGWWDETWMYRQAINISSHTSDETNVYITASIGLGSTDKAQTDAGDFRFLNSSGQLLPYYIVSGAGTTSITFHINLDSFPSGAQTLYAYYGNPSAENGFSTSDFSPEATNYTLGSQGSEEIGGGPIAYWRFDEGVGTTAFDSTGNNSHATFGTGTSAPSWISEDQCVNGKCLSFNGTTSYIGSSNLVTITEPYTVSFWMQPKKLGYQGIISLNGNNRPYIDLHSNNKILIYAGNEKYKYSSKIFQTSDLNKWFLVTCIVDDPNNLNTWKIYINGIDETGVSGANTDTYLRPTSNLKIGGISGGYFQGYLDEVKIYPYARTADQIEADYASGLAGMSSSSDSSVNIGGASSGKSLSDGLVGYWKFDEGVGNTSVDLSGNNKTASFCDTLVSTCNITGPTWQSGKFGSAPLFDGVNDGVLTSGIQTTNLSHSMSAWIYLNTTPSSFKYIFGANSGVGGLVVNSNLGLSYSSSGGANGITSNNSEIPLNQWIHVAVTADYNSTSGEVKLNLYKNGVNIKSVTTTPAIFYVRWGGIGMANGDTNNYSYSWWSGSIDEARIYNRALSPTEVKQLYEFAPGPITYWNFENSTGNTLPDVSSNGYDGTLNGNYTFTSGKIGKSIDLDGSTAYISTTTNTPKNMKDYTYTFWMKIEGDGAAGYNSTIYRVNGGGTNRLMINNSNKQILFQFPGSSDYGTYYNYTFSYNTWYHISFVKSILENSYKLYVNGNYIGSKGVVESDGGSGSFYLGYGGTERFNGKLDDFKIYNYARTQKQILEDMQATTPVGATTKVSQPIAWYKFDEGFGSTTANWGIGGTALNGTFGTGTSSPSWADGKVNKGLSFDGTTDYLTASGITIPNDQSISLWVKPNDTSYNEWIISLGNIWHYELSIRSNKLDFTTHNGTTYQHCTSSTSLSSNIFYHITTTYNHSAQEKKIYINGILSATCTNQVSNQVGLTNRVISIGGGSYFSGLIDEVKIYNYALSADQIKQDYNQGSSAVFGTTSQTIGATTTSLEYCVPGSTDYCAPPVGEWKFDEGVGATTYDISGNNYSGTFGTGTSSPSWSIGKFGKSLSFNSSQNQYVDLGNQKLVITGNVTVNTWIKTSSSGTNRAIVAKYGNSGAYTWRLAMNTTGNIIFNRGQSGTESYNTVVTSNKVINDNQWHYVTATFDSNYMKLYIDGQFDNQIAETRASDGLPTWEACVGDDGYTCGLAYGYSYWQGSIDQVRIYNYARTPAQIAYDYNRGEPVGHWKMDECQGTLINDWSGNSNHGTLSIGASGTQTSPGTCPATAGAWYNGKLGKLNASLNFDGSDDYVRINNPANGSLNFGTEDFTVAYWAKYVSVGTQGARQVSKRPGGLGPGWSVGVSSTGNLTYRLDDGVTPLEASFGSSGFVDNTWHHFVFVFDRDSYLYGFVDGKQSSTVNISSTSGSISNTSPLNFNTFNNLTSTATANCQIDDVRIYNYALTATQVKTLYNNGSVNFR